ncbi:MAG: DUF2752 domain-containing protein [Clostridia bacterium]|nr:DUF2752 domain-containing protein [Clostridia bacterium]
MKINNLKKRDRIFICLSINILLFILLYNLPIRDDGPTLCLHKLITGKECFNCGMTRACLSVLHFKFEQAWNYNWRVVIVLPYALIIYLYSWYKYVFKYKCKKLTK